MSRALAPHVAAAVRVLQPRQDPAREPRPRAAHVEGALAVLQAMLPGAAIMHSGAGAVPVVGQPSIQLQTLRGASLWRGTNAPQLRRVQVVQRSDETKGKPKPRAMRDYLLADCHLGDYDLPVESLLPATFHGVGIGPLDSFGPSKGSILRLHYRFGNWNVYVPWPTVWTVLGDGFCPAPNRYGYAPSAEFGNPTFQGETSVRSDLSRVEPFPYKTTSGTVYTPEVEFIFGEEISTTTLRRLRDLAKQDGVAKAVQAILKR